MEGRRPALLRLNGNPRSTKPSGSPAEWGLPRSGRATPATTKSGGIRTSGPEHGKRVAQLASEATYAGLISAGIRIWNFQPSMLHTKIMVVDGAADLVGSSNVNRRSLDHDEEVAMVVIDQASVDLLDHQFTEDLQRSRQIDLSRWQRRSAPQRTLETAVTAIRRWL